MQRRWLAFQSRVMVALARDFAKLLDRCGKKYLAGKKWRDVNNIYAFVACVELGKELLKERYMRLFVRYGFNANDASYMVEAYYNNEIKPKLASGLGINNWEQIKNIVLAGRATRSSYLW
jgi:pantothenate kinase